MLIGLIIVLLAIIIIFFIGLLKGIHNVRYCNGIDRELENDYRTIVSQKNK